MAATDLKRAQITLATLDAPVVALEDASYITLRGFVIESGLENGAEVRNGTECELVACEVRNLRRLLTEPIPVSQHSTLNRSQ